MIRAGVRGLGELLITAGLLLLLFVAWQLWWTDVQANREQATATTELHQQWGDTDRPASSAPEAPVDYGPPPVAPDVAHGTAFAIIHVPRFAEQSRPVLEGTGLDLLDQGVGHYEGTAMPGAVGNVALAGHRTTYGAPFNRIAELQPGDAIVLETADAWYTYRMRSSTIVTPDRVDVVAAVPEQPDAAPTERLLTLTSCHPMYSARQRFVVYAAFDSWQPKSAGEPESLAAPASPAATGPAPTLLAGGSSSRPVGSGVVVPTPSVASGVLREET